MEITKRRSFLQAGLASFPLTMFGQTHQTAPTPLIVKVAAGSDRLGEHHTLGVSTTDFKVVTGDAQGGLFVMEHSSKKKGGPPRHVHQDEDEFFYVIEGEYLMEIGTQRIQLKAGDSVLGPRRVPHGWAFVGDTPGKMLISFAPANKMESYFVGFKSRSGSYSRWDNPEDKEFARAHGVELVGPPLSVG